MIFWPTRYLAMSLPPSPSSVTFSPAVLGGFGVDDSTLEPALASPPSSLSTPISASVSTVTSFFLAAMMPLKEGKRGSLIFSVTLTTAGSVASRVNTPSLVSRSPVTLSPSSDSLRRWGRCGGAPPPGASGRSVPGDDRLGPLDGPKAAGQRPAGLDHVGAVHAVVLE